MFKSITLINFQRHKKLKVEFDKYITSIVGPSDAGKSALLRALRWVCLNEIHGVYRRHGSKRTVVSLAVEGATVTRTRTNSVNRYSRNGKRYNAVRKAVPDAIASLVGTSPHNFQPQFGSPFWLADSAGQVSRSLNSIVNLSIIDNTLSRLAAEVRRAHSTYDITEQRFKEAKAEAESLAWIEDIQAEYKEVERLGKASEAKATQAQNLRSLLRQAVALADGQEKAEKRLLLAKAAALAGQQAKAKATQSESLRQLLGQASEAECLSRLELPDVKALGAIHERRMALTDILVRVTLQEKEICQVQKQLRSKSMLLEKIMRKRCPVCGQPIRKT